MTIPNAPRRAKGDERPDHFSYLRGYKGEELYGYLAGRLIWIELHSSEWGSKPCLRRLTGGELTCAKCRDEQPVCKGACGFYHWRDFTPRFLWLDESKRDEYDALCWLDKLKFGREKCKGSPVWAQKCFEQDRAFSSGRPQCQCPVDLTESLLTIFNDNALTLWYRTTHGKGSAAAPVPAPMPAPEPEKKDKRKRANPMYAKAQEVADEMQRTGDDYDAVVERLRARMGGVSPSTNGKHDPPPKG